MFRVYVNLPEGICNDQTIIYHLHKYMIMLNDSNIQVLILYIGAPKRTVNLHESLNPNPDGHGKIARLKKRPSWLGKKWILQT